MRRSLIPVRFVIAGIYCSVIALTSSCYVYESAELMCDIDESHLAKASRIEIGVSKGAIHHTRRPPVSKVSIACDASNKYWSTVVSLTSDLIGDLCGGGSDALGNETALRWEQESTDSQKVARDQIASDDIRLVLTVRSSHCPCLWIWIAPTYIEITSHCIDPPNYLLVIPVSNSKYRGFLRYADTQYYRTTRAYIRMLYYVEQIAQATSTDFPRELREELYSYAKIDSSTRELYKYVRSKRK